MSARKQGKNNKRRFHEQVDNFDDKKKNINLSLCEVESRSSSCCSKKSNKKLNNKKNQGDRTDNFYIVEKIVGHKICNGKTYFKVQWQGYDESEDSWEPEENLTNVLDLIEDFKNNKISDDRSEENSRLSNSIMRSRNSGCYEYVPSNKVVATKTKYFDDIRDGKIDLTKNDLYSRVKTRKRLHLEEGSDKPMESMENEPEIITVEETNEVVETSIKTEDVPISFEKNKFYQSNLFEMTAEFMKTGSFKKSQNTIASKSSSNDDISLFNYSISPNTNQSDDFPVQISPAHVTNIESLKQSVHTQTISQDFEAQEPAHKEVMETQLMDPILSVKPHIQKIIDKIDQSFGKPSSPKRFVTNDTDLLQMYSKNIRQGTISNFSMPNVQIESDLISIDNFEDLKCSILMDKYHLLYNTLQSGVKFDWNEKFIPECLTPLQLAVTKNRVNIVRLLLRYGAPPDFTDNTDTESPLILASSLGYIHAVKALLDHGAFTDYRIKTCSALYFAIENGRVDVVSMLLKFGTNFYRVADNLSGSSLINDMFMGNRLSNVVYVDLLALLRSYHMSFINSLNRTITRYFTKHFIKQICIIFPHQWVSVLEKEFHVDFLLDSTIMTNIDTPILLLVHGIQADCDFDFWLDNNCCCIESVYVNDARQSSLSASSSFVTTLWPLNASSNKLTVNFTDQHLLSPEEKQIRIAIVAVSVDCTRSTGGASGTNINRNINSTFHQLTHSRNYHRSSD